MSASADIPRSLDELVRDSRARVARLRRQYGNREDFDEYARRAIERWLDGCDRQTVAFTMRAIFGD
jgi:hypothetical protein